MISLEDARADLEEQVREVERLAEHLRQAHIRWARAVDEMRLREQFAEDMRLAHQKAERKAKKNAK